MYQNGWKKRYNPGKPIFAIFRLYTKEECNMKIHVTGNNYYLLKVAFFFLVTLVVYFYFGNIEAANNKLNNSNFFNLTAAGVKSIYFSGIHFFIFTLGLFVVNPKLNLMLESAIVAAIIQFLFFTLTVYGAINLNYFIVEMLVGIAITSVLIDNLYTRKIRGARIGFSIAFSMVYGVWLANYFLYSGISPQSNLEVLLAVNAGITAAEISVVALAFLLLGKLLADTKNYRSLVVIPLTVISFLVITIWAVRQLI